MRRVLLTGMSGVGKSTVVRELVARGHTAVDTDDGWCEPLPDGRQQWREAAVRALLDRDDTDLLFLAGCEENQVVFHDRFDHIVLLSAPREVMLERLATRTDNAYGKQPAELRRVLADLESVEPLLRQVATHEISTTAPVDQVVDAVLRVVDA